LPWLYSRITGLLEVVGSVYYFHADADHKQDQQQGIAAEKKRKDVVVELIIRSV
jgi:hypothetical protein